MGWSDWPHSVESGCLVPVLAVLKAELARVGGKTGISRAKKATKKTAKTSVAQSSQSILKLIKAVKILPQAHKRIVFSSGKYPDEDTLEQVSTIGAAILGRYKIPLDTTSNRDNGLIEDFVHPDVEFGDFYGKRQLYFALSKKDIWKAGAPKNCLVDLCSFIGIDPKEVAHQTWGLIVP